MSKYSIYFGRDYDKLEYGWSDDLNLDNPAEIEQQTVGKIETDDLDFLWVIIMNIRDNPPSMWYWVCVDKEVILSGAIDPDDIEILAENIECPKWIDEFINKEEN